MLIIFWSDEVVWMRTVFTSSRVVMKAADSSEISGTTYVHTDP